MNVLVLCEFSGEVRESFRERGHYAASCDLLPSEKSGIHFQISAIDILKWDFTWDLILAFPPCTYLSNSGVRWLYNNDGSRNLERWTEMEKAAKFFRLLLAAPAKRVVLENPIQHKYARQIIDKPYSPIVSERKARVHREPPSIDRWKNRSRTLTGIANAMAQQWG